MADNKVFTAPKAFITIDNKAAGYIKGLTFTESIQRIPIRGIGSLALQGAEAGAIDQSFTIDEMFISFDHPSTKALLNRYVANSEDLSNTLVLGEFAFDIIVYSKLVTGRDATNRLVEEIDKTGKTMFKLGRCLINNQSFNLNEMGMAGFNTSGIYLNPITFIK